jgi:tRNA threonylcarbamoyladenosine biosynthesis protein TsaE
VHPRDAGLEVRVVDETAAPDVLAVIRAAFGARPPLDPPAAALSETEETVAAELKRYGGLLARDEEGPVGSLLFDESGHACWLRRFGVVPRAQGTGVAQALVALAEQHAAEQRWPGLRVVARAELPASLRFWKRSGFRVVGRTGHDIHLLRILPVELTLDTAEDTRALGARLAPLLRAGDLLLLSGDLGAGKTTFTQGLGRALGVRGQVTSPTFVIARVHPPEVGDLPLVHVDAYRLHGTPELDDLDLDTDVEDAVTVVEWGEGVAEDLADNRLEITLLRSDEDDDETRRAIVQPVGLRWLGVRLPDAPQ